MNAYIENPKTAGSGIVCAIPQTGECPNKCPDCFFQSGRSYLEPLVEHLPNIPPQSEIRGRIVRVNDGHDSFYLTNEMIQQCIDKYPDFFFNTAVVPYGGFWAFRDRPFVLTVNRGPKTDKIFDKLDEIPPNLMFVRVRVNTWNLQSVVMPAVEYYTSRGVPVVLTFMAYYNEEIPIKEQIMYEFKKRTLNDYWCIKSQIWRTIERMFDSNPLVHSCGSPASTLCKHCGNCLREYYATKNRMRGEYF